MKSLTDIATTAILTLFSGGVVTAFIAWLRDRGKDASAVHMMDLQALQAKLVYVEGVADYLRKDNEYQNQRYTQLQKDYDELDAKYRDVRQHMIMLEDELDRVKRSSAHTQAECETLSVRIKALLGEVERDERRETGF